MALLNYSCFANNHRQCPGHTAADPHLKCECVCHMAGDLLIDKEDDGWTVLTVVDENGEVDEEWVHSLLHAQTQAAMIQVEDIDDMDVLKTALTNTVDMIGRLQNTLFALGIEGKVMNGLIDDALHPHKVVAADRKEALKNNEFDE